MTPDQALAPIKARLEAVRAGDEWEPYNRGIGYEIHLHGIPVNDNLRETFNKADAVFIANAPTDITRLLAAIEAVEKLHVPVQVSFADNSLDYYECRHCDSGDEYPCPTVAALSEALGGGK